MLALLAVLLFLASFVGGITAFVYAIILYNELIRLRNETDRAWANIDVLLKQRHDEIPNLVATVKGYMQHEQQTLEYVAQARAQSINAVTISEKAQADLATSGALKNLFSVAENYPQLKADQSFLRLQSCISEIEERIADRREYFNDDVYLYNTRLHQVPEVFVARVLGMKPRELFKVLDKDQQQTDLGLIAPQKAAV
jgi:LemA protein